MKSKIIGILITTVILVVAGIFFMFLSPAMARFVPYNKPDIKEDFCGIVVDYKYCKCAWHNIKEHCKAVGMDQSSAAAYVTNWYNSWAEEHKEKAKVDCQSADGLWHGNGCEYCEPPSYWRGGICTHLHELCSDDGIVRWDDTKKKCYCPEGYNLEPNKTCKSICGDDPLIKYDAEKKECYCPEEYKLMKDNVCTISRDIPQEKVAAKVLGIKGKAYLILKDGRQLRLTENTILIDGDIIRTEEGAKVGLIYLDAVRTSLGQNSEIEIKKPEEEKEEKTGILEIIYRVTYGLIFLETPEGRKFGVESPTAIIGVRGTKFIVKVDQRDQSTSVYVLEGEVEVSDIAEQKILILKQGETSKTEASGALSEPKGYEKKEVKLMLEELEELEIKKGIPLWLWIIIGLVIVGIIVGLAIVLSKKKQKVE